MKLPRVHIVLGVREDDSCVTLYAGPQGSVAEETYRNAPSIPGRLGGALLFKLPLPAKKRTFPVTEPIAVPDEKADTTPVDLEALAGALYEQYCAAVGGVALNGDPLPKWSEFRADAAKQKQSDAWMIVAKTAQLAPSELPPALPPNESAPSMKAADKASAKKTSSRKTSAASSPSDQL